MTVGAKIAISAVALGLLTAGCIVYNVLRVYDYPLAAAELPRAVAEAQSLGIPMTSAELTTSSSHADSVRASETLQKFPPYGQHGWTNYYFNLLSDRPDWSAARKALVTNEGPLEDLRALLKGPVVHLDYDYDTGPDLKSPELDSAKGAGCALCVSALVKSHDGHFKVADEDLAAARKVGEFCGQQTLGMLGFLFRESVDAWAFKAAEICLNDAANDADGLKSIQQTVLNDEPQYDLKLAFKGDAFMAVTITRNLEKFGGLKVIAGPATGAPYVPPDPKSLQRSGVPSSMTSKAYMARMLQYWAKVFRYMDQHPGDAVGLDVYGNQLESELEAHESSLSWLVNVILCPNVGTPALGSTFKTATFRSKLALAQVLQFRLAHKRFPETLEEAGVKELDPFDGGPLKYKMHGPSIRIWSVGPNQKDDGGVSAGPNGLGSMRTWDIVTTYPLVRTARKV